jgi:hypothetical protein
MEMKPQKTMDERVKFMKSFADITENNPLLKNNYNIEFADVNYLTEFYINNKDGQRMDLSVLLTGEEYRVFLTLAAKWKE